MGGYRAFEVIRDNLFLSSKNVDVFYLYKKDFPFPEGEIL